jgi:ParB-like chromosome segregation protein Spo0J
MIIENVKVSDLIPYIRNNKEHDKEQVKMIANSIKEFGFNQPLVID